MSAALLPGITPETVLDHLPHAFPFRFVDAVTRHTPATELQARFSPERIPAFLRGTDGFPEVCVLEGLAQATVLFVILETGPLAPGEMPLLGHLAFRITGAPTWDRELRYSIRPIRMTASQGIFEATATEGTAPIAQGVLSVARRMQS